MTALKPVHLGPVPSSAMSWAAIARTAWASAAAASRVASSGVAASDPRTRATTVAPRAMTIEVRKASRRPVFAIACSIHFVESELGGHADVPFSLNA